MSFWLISSFTEFITSKQIQGCFLKSLEFLILSCPFSWKQPGWNMTVRGTLRLPVFFLIELNEVTCLFLIKALHPLLYMYNLVSPIMISLRNTAIKHLKRHQK